MARYHHLSHWQGTDLTRLRYDTREKKRGQTVLWFLNSEKRQMRSAELFMLKKTLIRRLCKCIFLNLKRGGGESDMKQRSLPITQISQFTFTPLFVG